MPNALYRVPDDLRNALSGPQDVMGMDPNVNRLSLLPRYSAQEGMVAPQWLYDLARAAMAPGNALMGHNTTPEEAFNFAGNLVGTGIGARVGSPSKPGEIGMQVYHGSDRVFDQIDPAMSGAQHATTEGSGAYLTTSDRYARTFGKNLYTVELDDKAPVLFWDRRVSEQPLAAGLMPEGVNLKGIKSLARENARSVFQMSDTRASAVSLLKKTDDEILADAAAGILPHEYKKFVPGQDTTGKDLYKSLEAVYGKKQAAKKLRDAGFGAMEMGTEHDLYGARAPRGTRNFVIFDPSIAKILSRE